MPPKEINNNPLYVKGADGTFHELGFISVFVDDCIDPVWYRTLELREVKNNHRRLHGEKPIRHRNILRCLLRGW